MDWDPVRSYANFFSGQWLRTFVQLCPMFNFPDRTRWFRPVPALDMRPLKTGKMEKPGCNPLPKDYPVAKPFSNDPR